MKRWAATEAMFRIVPRRWWIITGSTAQQHTITARKFTASIASHRQVLDRDVVDQLVVAALQEGRIDAQDRPHALAGEARGKRHRVLLGDADVEVAAGKTLRVLHPAGAFADRRRGLQHAPGAARP